MVYSIKVSGVKDSQNSGSIFVFDLNVRLSGQTRFRLLLSSQFTAQNGGKQIEKESKRGREKKSAIMLECVSDLGKEF